MEEVYCALNRARGSELVSPEEVYSAAKAISKTYPAAGLLFKKYDSGIAVLQDSSLSDTAVVERLLALITEFPNGLSAENYSAKAGFRFESVCSWHRQPVFKKQAQRQIFWLKI